MSPTGDADVKPMENGLDARDVTSFTATIASMKVTKGCAKDAKQYTDKDWERHR